MGIKIITDSACDLKREYIDKNNIGLLSLVLNLNDEVIKDDLGETLSYKDFYRQMREGATPTTSQVNAHEFEEEFMKYVKNGDSIICITISSALSGTFNSANIARNNILEEYPEAKIELVDSLSVSMGQGLLVLKACEMKDNGASIEEIVQWLEDNKRKVIHSILIDERAINAENEVIYICHGDCLEEAESLRNIILQEVKLKDIIINYVGNVVGAHAGPGVLAVVYLGKNR